MPKFFSCDERRVIYTLAYSHQFGFPLTTKEIHLRLVSISCESKKIDKTIKIEDIEQICKSLHRRKIIQKRGGYWAINTVERSVVNRGANYYHSLWKWQEVEQIVNFAKKIPFILAVAVTGSLAVNNSAFDDDIDILIVAQNHTMWVARPLLIFYSILMKKRRSWIKEEKNSWCFNLWLEESQLMMSKNRRSIYSAYEVCQAKFVFDRSGVERNFLNSNNWVAKILPQYFANRLGESLTARQDSSHGKFLLNILIYFLNIPAYFLQHLYMRPHMTREEVGFDKAFFHPRDTRSMVSSRWKKVVGTLLEKKSRIQKVVLVTGVFDILHSEHLNFLKAAKFQGDLLVVGIESDKRTRKLKGENRPINAQVDRRQNLLNLMLADQVVVLPDQFSQPADHLKLLESIHPDILAVSAHTDHLAAKRTLMSHLGGQVVVVHPHNPRISTTKILLR